MDNSLTRLSQVILQSAVNITKGCEAQGIKVPSLDDTQPVGPVPLFDEKIAVDAANIMAAAQELLAILNPPELYVFDIAQGSMRTAAIRAARQLHVAEIISEGDPKGVHVDDIARISNVDSSKLARVLRLLTLSRIFREVEPNIFANNRISCALDSGQPISVLVSSPEMKYDRPDSVVMAWMDYFSEYPAKAGAYLTEILKDSNSPVVPDYLRRLKGADQSEWQAKEMTDPYSLHNFVRRSVGSTVVPQYGFNMFNKVQAFEDAKPDAKVVGLGFLSGQTICDLAKTFPKLTFVVNDSSEQLKDEKLLWQMWNADPDQVKSGRVRLEGTGDIAALENAAVFVIVWNLLWSDEQFKKNLVQLRQAANEDTSLVFGNWDISSKSLSDTTGTSSPLVTWGSLISTTDCATLLWSNGKNRPLENLQELLEQTGWRVANLHRHFPYMVIHAKPV